MMDWKPIETAPRDGTWVLITGCNNSNLVAYACWVIESPFDSFHEPGWRGVWEGYDQWMAPPTHWMPMPEPPTP